MTRTHPGFTGVVQHEWPRPRGWTPPQLLDARDVSSLAGVGPTLAKRLRTFGISLLGGDTVSAPTRVLGLTAIGQAARVPPNRSGASPGDQLWVSGTIGDGGAGLRALLDGEDAPELIERYRNPRPRLEAGELAD